MAHKQGRYLLHPEKCMRAFSDATVTETTACSSAQGCQEWAVPSQSMSNLPTKHLYCMFKRMNIGGQGLFPFLLFPPLFPLPLSSPSPSTPLKTKRLTVYIET